MIAVRLFEGTSVEGEEHLHPHTIVRQTTAQHAVEKPLTGKRALDCSFAGGDGEESDGEKREFRSSVSKGSPRQSNVVAGAFLILLGLDVVVILLKQLMSLIKLRKEIGAGGESTILTHDGDRDTFLTLPVTKRILLDIVTTPSIKPLLRIVLLLVTEPFVRRIER